MKCALNKQPKNSKFGLGKILGLVKRIGCNYKPLNYGQVTPTFWI